MILQNVSDTDLNFLSISREAVNVDHKASCVPRILKYILEVFLLFMPNVD